MAYGQSKTACVLLAVEATRRWAGEGVFANALNPGAIATNLQKHTGGLKTPPERRKTPQQGVVLPPYAIDPANAERLWDVAMQLVS